MVAKDTRLEPNLSQLVLPGLQDDHLILV
jgi:hypothetical protein